MNKTIRLPLLVFVLSCCSAGYASEALDRDSSLPERLQHMNLSQSTLNLQKVEDLRRQAYQCEQEAFLFKGKEHFDKLKVAFQLWNQLAHWGDNSALDKLATYYAEGIENHLEKNLHKAGLLLLRSYISGNYMLYEHLKGKNPHLLELTEQIKAQQDTTIKKQLAQEFANLYAQASN